MLVGVKRGVSSPRTCTGSWERRAESQSGGRREASRQDGFPSMQHDIMNPEEAHQQRRVGLRGCRGAKHMDLRTVRTGF